MSKSVVTAEHGYESRSLKLFLGLAIAVAALLGGSFISFQWFGQQIRRNHQQHLLEIATLKANRIEQWLAERKADAIIFTARPSVKITLQIANGMAADANSQAIATTLLPATLATKSAYGYDRIVLIDAQGQAVLSSGSNETLPEAVSIAFQQKIRPFPYAQEAQFIDLNWIETTQGKKLAFGILAPVYAQDRKLIGAVYLENNPYRYLYPLLQSWPTSNNTAETLLVRRESNEIRYLTPLRFKNIVPLEFALPTSQSQVLANQASSNLKEFPLLLTGLDYVGNQVIGAAITIRNTPWLMIAKVDIQESDAPVNQLAITISSLTLFLIAIAVYIAYQIRRTDLMAIQVVKKEAEKERAIAIADSASRYLNALETSIDGFAILDRHGKFTEVNTSLCQIFGYSFEEFRNLSIFDLDATTTNPEQALENLIALKKGKLQQTWLHRNGKQIDIQLSISYLEQNHGQFFIFVQDITQQLQLQHQLERSTQIHTLLSRVNEKIVRTKDPQELLNQVCQIAIEQGKFPLAWVGSVNPETLAVEPIAYAIKPDEYRQEGKMPLESIMQTVQHHCCLSMCKHETVVINDLWTESVNQPFQEQALQYGIRAVAIFPLQINVQIKTLLGFYASEKDFFDESVMPLLEELLEDIRLALRLADSEKQRQKVERDLLQSEERLRCAILDAPLPIVLHASNGEILQINRMWTSLTGYSIEDVPTVTDWVNKVYKENAEEIKAMIARTYQSSQATHDGEAELFIKDGSKRYWDFWSSPLGYLPDGRSLMISMAMDVTERKASELLLAKAKVDAEVANQAKSDFLASMSHELRTPLNGILGYAQILMLEDNATQQQRESYETIYQCGSHLLSLITEILDLAKIEAHRLDINYSKVSLANFLSDLARMCEIKALEKNLVLKCEFDQNLPTYVLADSKHLRQVLLNILGNAIKFTDVGAITFRVEPLTLRTDEGFEQDLDISLAEVAKIRFMVTDTGKGIAPEHLHKIFLPFEQVGDRKNRPEGTGLGLAISQKLVKLMGSDIHLDSELNRGSCFWFDLELAQIADTITHQKSIHIYDSPYTKIKGYQGKRMTVLVVDDRQINRAVMKHLLEPLGFVVMEADSGYQGLEMLHTNWIDLVLVDLVMPEMDGFEMVKQLRKNMEFQQIPIIAMSASIQDEEVRKSIEYGCDDFLPKPIDSVMVLDKLQKYLHLSWMTEDSFLS
ncbi:MAG: PAS domain S-box protein [Pseudanabaenaceae cyanobacterium bins.39]|nr:PAS domain S-box protein [Pseudanabaenaceae cyanobacterium bins.39]